MPKKSPCPPTIVKEPQLACFKLAEILLIALELGEQDCSIVPWTLDQKIPCGLRFLVCIPALPTHGCLLQSIYSLWNMEVRMAPCGLVQGKCILRWVTPLWSRWNPFNCMRVEPLVTWSPACFRKSSCDRSSNHRSNISVISSRVLRALGKLIKYSFTRSMFFHSFPGNRRLSHNVMQGNKGNVWEAKLCQQQPSFPVQASLQDLLLPALFELHPDWPAACVQSSPAQLAV